MSFELMMLAAASLWGFLQLVAAAQAANAQYGLKWAASPRDVEMPPLKPIPGRINRNFRNYMETFPFFAVAVLVAQAAGVHNELTHGDRLPISAGASLTPRFTYPEYRSSARCSGTSPPLACSQFWRRRSCRAEASGGTPARDRQASDMSALNRGTNHSATARVLPMFMGRCAPFHEIAIISRQVPNLPRQPCALRRAPDI